MTVGGTQLAYDLSWVEKHGGQVITFELWGSLMGSVLAFMICTISVFSVPLV